ncbi:MAG TPA: hypothetical protein VF943_14590 [Burkholderiales bacterium]
MNPTAIYSKTGKGVQEASGKTSLLKRPDRAVLSAIDGRATLGDVAQKVGKTFDADFEKLVGQLDKDGFVREVSPGVAPAAPKGAAPAARTPPRPAAPAADPGGDLDFSSITPAPKPAAPPSRPAAPPPRPAAPPTRPAAPPPPPPRPAAPPPAAKPAPPQQSALDKAREEAEARAAAEKEKQKALAEGKAVPSADAEARLRAEAEAKIKAAREAAVRTATEAKAKADAEAKRVREEAEKAKRESEELKQRLEEERKAREAAERKVKDEAERARKELDEERKQLDVDRKKREEEDRKRREEAEQKEEEDRTARRKREDEEEKERRKKREEEERKAEEERAARRKHEEEEEKERKRKKEEERRKHDEEERKAAEERTAKRKREAEEEERKAEEERAARKKKRDEEEKVRARAEEEERQRRAAEEEAERERLAAEEADRRKSQEQKSIAEMTPPKPGAPQTPAPAAGGGAFDSLLNDLDSFGKKDDEEDKAREAAERKSKADAERREREEEERRAAEERAAERKRQADEEERKEEEKRAARKKQREDEERQEEEERKAKEKKRRDKEEAEAAEAEAKSKKEKEKEREREKEKEKAEAKARQEAEKAEAKKGKEKARAAPSSLPPSMRRDREPGQWGKKITLALFLLLVIAVGVVHVMPLGTADYERAASEALGVPVKINSGRMWLFTGLQLRLQGVTIGELKLAEVTAFPSFDSLSGDRKLFTRIEVAGVTLPQQGLAAAMASKVKGEKFIVGRIVVRQMELSGPLPLPKNLEADIALDAEGAVSSITLRGPDSLVAKLTPKGSAMEFDLNASGFTIPIAPDVTLGTFGMKGTATRNGMSVTEWDGTYLNGRLSGTANVRWGNNWVIDGVMTARGINAAVFAPALVSEGRGEGTAKFSMSGPDPMALVAAGRYDASFRIDTGALGGVDLSRAIRTGGRETAGRTTFTEMTGQATYDRGAVSARNVQITQGSLNAGISADISRDGALSGRIVSDVRAGSQILRVTLTMGGTTRDPQFRP